MSQQPTFELAQQVLAAQPFSVAVGARLTTFGDRAATLDLDLRNDLRQQNGYLHGGMISYLADNAITFAAGTVLGASVLTSSLAIEYARPAVGPQFRAVARVVHAGSRSVVCHCEVLSLSDGDAPVVVAVAQGTVRSRSTT